MHAIALHPETGRERQPRPHAASLIPRRLTSRQPQLWHTYHTRVTLHQGVATAQRLPLTHAQPGGTWCASGALGRTVGAVPPLGPGSSAGSQLMDAPATSPAGGPASLRS